MKNHNLNILAFFLFYTFLVSAQVVLSPSNFHIDNEWIKNKTYQMKWYAQKDTSKIDIGEVSTQIVIKNSILTVVSEVSRKNTNVKWVDTTLAKLSSLKPIKHVSFNAQRDLVLNFGKTVSGYYFDKVKNNKISINDTVKSEYFDSNLYPLIIGWLPLKDNFSQEIAIYDFNPLSSKTGLLKVFLKNTFSGKYQSEKNGLRDVWIVVVFDEISNGESKYYFDKIDRKLWFQEIDVQGRKMFMKLIE